MEHIKRVMHGESKTRLYRIWSNLKNRVLPNSVKAKYYFDRGIGLCDEWKNSFISFRDWSINNGYDDKLTIDRIDNNLGYSPENCRWVDMKVQANNRSNNITVYADKSCVPFSDVCRILGVDYKTAYDKIIMNLVENKNVENIGKDEQKPAEDRYMEGYLNGTNDALKTLKPTTWSEEDLYKIEHALFGTYAVDTATRILNKIKSLRPQSQWKPSDEQMDALLVKIPIENSCNKVDNILKSLYSDLKRLK